MCKINKNPEMGYVSGASLCTFHALKISLKNVNLLKVFVESARVHGAFYKINEFLYALSYFAIVVYA